MAPPSPPKAAPAGRRQAPAFVLVSAAVCLSLAVAAALLPQSLWLNGYYALFSSWGCVVTEGHVDSRFFRPDVCVTPRERSEAITRLVHEMSAMLETRDLDYWLDSGTLLGQFRRQRVIPWDNDADFGVTTEAFEQLRTLEWHVPEGYKLQVLGSKFYDDGHRDWNIPARLVDRKLGFYVDVFVFAEGVAPGGIELLGPPPSDCWARCAKCLTVGSGKAKLLLIPKSYVFPLLRCRFAGFDVLCPAKRSLYLDHIYGPDFRTEMMASSE